jgi:hypothetical protein
MSIPRGVERHVDLVHVQKDHAEDAKRTRGQPPIVLDVLPEPEDHRNDVLASEFEVDLVVTSDNAEAVRYTVTVAYDGDWPGEPDENRIWAGFRIEIARR